jgi:internalin A
MYELVEIADHKEFQKRVSPVVLGDAHIYKPVGRAAYIKHWEEEINQLDAAIRDVMLTKTDNLLADLNKYRRIRDRFDDMTHLLSDMNTLTSDVLAANGFAALIRAIEAEQV